MFLLEGEDRDDAIGKKDVVSLIFGNFYYFCIFMHI